MESSGERTIAAIKDTNGVLEDFVMISSLVCVGNGPSDLGHSTENSRPKSCETVIPVPPPSPMSSTLSGASLLIAQPPGRIARPRNSRITVNSRSFARPLSLRVIHKAA